MKTAYLFLAEGFEEIEAVAPLDILRRAGIETKTVSVSAGKIVTGAHGIPVVADLLFEDTTYEDANLLILPGGMPGTINLQSHEGLRNLLLNHAQKGEAFGAICAAPRILGSLGLLANKEATCYPGNEGYLENATLSEYMVVQDGTVVTASGAGVACEFGLQLVQLIKGEQAAEAVASKMLMS